MGSSEYGLLLRGEVCGPPRPGIEWGLPPIPGGQGKHGRVGKPGIIPPPGGNPGGSRLPKPGGSPHPFDAAAAAAAAAAMDGGNPAAFAAWRNGKGSTQTLKLFDVFLLCEAFQTSKEPRDWVIEWWLKI